MIEIALRELEERTFWGEVERAFERSAADPAEAARQAQEIGIWERVSEADFKDERW